MSSYESSMRHHAVELAQISAQKGPDAALTEARAMMNAAVACMIHTAAGDAGNLGHVKRFIQSLADDVAGRVS